MMNVRVGLAWLVAARMVLAAPTIEVACDRADALYRRGETATFTARVSDPGGPAPAGELRYRLTFDGGRLLEEGTRPLVDGAATVTARLEEVGIARLQVTFGEANALAAAAFDPEQIPAAADEPADFDAFWDAQKALLAQVPIDAQLTERPDLSNDQMTVYRITLGNIDASRVRGWLALPKSVGPHPAVLTVPWAGVYPTPTGLIGWAQQGFVAMAISAHDVDVDLPQADYDALNAGALAGYPHQGRDSRDTFYFRRVYLSIVRAIDYLTSRDDWDGRTMVVTGSSQGGGLSLVAAGLDPRVTAIAANVPALCDHLGYRAGRQSGWPRLVPGDESPAAAVSAYYDAVNFARRASCPAVVGVGLIDTVCPPSGIFAAYNLLRGPKQIVISPLMGHSQSPEYGALVNRFIPDQAKPAN